MFQASLDEFAKDKAYETFANIASRYIIHHNYLHNHSLFWYYESPPVENVEEILRLYGIEKELSKTLVDVAISLSSKETISDIEKLMGGHKVRKGHDLVISKDVSSQLLSKYKKLLPPELISRWYKS